MERTNASGLFEVSEIELVYKSRVKASERPHITSSKSAYEILLKAWDEKKIEFLEQFKVLLLAELTRYWEFMKYHQEALQEQSQTQD